MHQKWNADTRLEIDYESLILMMKRVYSAALGQHMVLGDEHMESRIDKIVASWEEYKWLKEVDDATI